jgi:anthranilate synthase/aminodeoxychorismate synthase-like glutamine amidotransferase
VAAARRLNPQAIVLSPGPCTPNEAGCSLDVVRQLHASVPMLGVCLGHQAIAAALGAKVVRSPEPMHGRTSLVHHDGQGVFGGAPEPLRACRYHSLVVEEASLPLCLEANAWAEDGMVMGLQHRELPVVGVQFHPESILTDAGYLMLANFLRLAGLTPKAGFDPREELPTDAAPTSLALTRPVTF